MAPSQLGIFTRSSPDHDGRTSSFMSSRCRSTSSAIRCIASRLHRQRLQPAPDQPRHDPSRAPPILPPRRSSGRTISRPRGPAGRCRRHPRHAPRCASRALQASRRRNSCPAPAGGDDELAGQGRRRDRHHDLPSRRHGEDGHRRRSAGRGRRAAELRGVAGLRVLDASVMPRITSGNTNRPPS